MEENLISVAMTLATLIVLEVILGIDNLLFLSILTEKLPKPERKQARFWGLTFAWITRLFLLAFAVVLVGLNTPLFIWGNIKFSIHTLFLLFGGFFLVAKAVQEIHLEVMPKAQLHRKSRSHPAFWKVVSQIVMMDVIFSIDSVMTAIGLTTEFWIMGIAISVAILGMLYLSNTIATFIRTYPPIKMLALAFLFLIGTFLVADGLSFHIPREYLYVVLIFSLSIEILNMLKNKQKLKK